MFSGAHWLLYSTDAEADRAFFRDVLRFPAVDAGEGWLIFGLPAGELGVHPGDGSFTQRHGEQRMLGALLYLMCADLDATIAALQARGVQCSPPTDAGWGIVTTLRLPSGGEIGLYQPRHPTAIGGG